MAMKLQRVEARLSPKERDQIERAARFQGQFVFSFIVEAAIERAEHVLVERTVTIVSAVNCRRCRRVAGSKLVVVDAIDDRAASFYESHDLLAVPGNPRQSPAARHEAGHRRPGARCAVAVGARSSRRSFLRQPVPVSGTQLRKNESGR